MYTAKLSSFRFRACVRCGGDAYLDLIDEPEWRCLQCGRTIPPKAATGSADSGAIAQVALGLREAESKGRSTTTDRDDDYEHASFLERYQPQR